MSLADTIVGTKSEPTTKKNDTLNKDDLKKIN